MGPFQGLKVTESQPSSISTQNLSPRVGSRSCPLWCPVLCPLLLLSTPTLWPSEGWQNCLVPGSFWSICRCGLDTFLPFWSFLDQIPLLP